MVPLMGRCCGYLMTLPQLLDHLQNFHNLNDLITCYICENVNSLTAHLVEHMEQSDDDLVEQSTETDDDLVEHLAQPDNNLVKLLAQPDDDESIGNATSQYSRWPEIHPLDQPITNESNFEWVKKYDRLECSQFWSDEYGLELNHPGYDLGEEIEHLLRGLIGMGEVFVARKLVFFPQRNWDLTFGCGYRNLQILTETLRHYRNIAQRSKINRMPHFIEIQRDIELAWDDGFIRELNTTLLGSYEWLGCVEVTTFLGYRGILAHTVDVNIRDNSSKGINDEIFNDFVYNYYKLKKPSFPIFLQYKGHSVSVIGIAVRFGKKIPLIFDPMIDLRLFLDDLKNNGNAIFVELKKTLDILKRHELFQMVVTRRTVRTLEEYNCNKITQIGFNRFSLSSIQCFNTNYFTDEYW